VLFRVEGADVNHWMAETYPVILTVYDAQADVAYWLYLQAHFAAGQARLGTGNTVTVRISAANILDEVAIRRFAAAKVAIQKQLKEVPHE
jgi:hypothetical protein